MKAFTAICYGVSFAALVASASVALFARSTEADTRQYAHAMAATGIDVGVSLGRTLVYVRDACDIRHETLCAKEAAVERQIECVKLHAADGQALALCPFV